LPSEVDFFRQTLSMAERHVALCETHIDIQTKLIAELERDGHDATQAKSLLSLFKRIQAVHLQYRDHLKKELSEAELGSGGKEPRKK